MGDNGNHNYVGRNRAKLRKKIIITKRRCYIRTYGTWEMLIAAAPRFRDRINLWDGWKLVVPLFYFYSPRLRDTCARTTTISDVLCLSLKSVFFPPFFFYRDRRDAAPSSPVIYNNMIYVYIRADQGQKLIKVINIFESGEVQAGLPTFLYRSLGTIFDRRILIHHDRLVILL